MIDLAYLLARSVQSGECRLWTGSTKEGYGRAWEEGKETGAHRAAYQVYHGVTLTTDDLVCHSCDVLACIAEAHLFKGTSAINSADMVSKGRSMKGAKHHAAVLTPAHVAEIKDAPRGYGTGVALARKFGVSPTTISMVRCGATWR